MRALLLLETVLLLLVLGVLPLLLVLHVVGDEGRELLGVHEELHGEVALQLRHLLDLVGLLPVAAHRRRRQVLLLLRLHLLDLQQLVLVHLVQHRRVLRHFTLTHHLDVLVRPKLVNNQSIITRICRGRS